MFLYEVKQQQLLSGVRTFLKVYSTISLGKLAAYMEVDEPTLRCDRLPVFFRTIELIELILHSVIHAQDNFDDVQTQDTFCRCSRQHHFKC